MRKVVAGCLVALLLAVVVLGVALYFGYRAARPLVDEAAGWMRQARELSALSEDVVDRSPYTAPADGELTEDQVRRFLAVHARVRETMGPRWGQLQERAKAFDGQGNGDGRASLSEMGAVLSELGSLAVDARRAQVAALNAEGFSSAEYSWVRLRVYEAAGFETMMAIDWSALEAMLKRGAGEVGATVPEVKLPEIPARNRELVKPHIASLREWLPLTVLGF